MFTFTVLNIEPGQDDVTSVPDHTEEGIMFYIQKNFVACDQRINQKLYQKIKNGINNGQIEDFEICLPSEHSNGNNEDKKRLHFDRLRG